jgi:AraC family transcriptional regulator of adaptative response/methylated-DNA-[protein]-cysteine methyltransferase
VVKDRGAQEKPMIAASLDTDAARWQAIVQRDRAADGVFVYSVRTTGVYCRPCCGARLPRRENVRFHAAPAEAERAGFRPCRRCKPNEAVEGREREAVTRACRLIETASEVPSLGNLAAAVGMSPHSFHRLFKRITGVTPKSYASAKRAGKAREALTDGATVTETIHAAGFGSNGRFYDSAAESLGMTPTAYRSGGDGSVIRFAVGDCSLGSVLVAATEKGVCAIRLGDDPEALVRNLQDRFPKAQFIGGDAGFESTVAAVVGLVERPSLGLDLPLDIRGTAFQVRVWQALRKIPAGSTATYAEIAAAIGQPKAVRAVAGACAANPIAIAVPCHRVVRTDESLSGYRWGVERKAELLRREKSSR